MCSKIVRTQMQHIQEAVRLKNKKRAFDINQEVEKKIKIRRRNTNKTKYEPRKAKYKSKGQSTN